MKHRLWLFLAVVTTAGALWVLRPVPAAVVPPAPRPRPPRAPLPPPSVADHGPLRNVFAYGDEVATAVDGDLAPAESLEWQPLTPPSPVPEGSPIRLVGLVRKPGRLAAAVSINGAVVVLAAGESADGYTVLTVDEENGARVRGPDGAELSLAAPGT